MPKHKLPIGFSERIRAKEDAKKQRTADSPPSTTEQLKKTLKEVAQGKKTLQKEQEKTNEVAGQALLENLDKQQLLALLQLQMQGGNVATASVDATDGKSGEEKGEEEGDENEEDQYDLLNTLFSAIEENQEKTKAMQHMFDGMNCMAATLLASTQAQAKEKEPDVSAEQARKQRMIIGENILERLGKQQKKTEEESRATQVLNVLTESLAPLVAAKQAATQKTQTTSKRQPSASNQSAEAAATTKKPSSDKRKKLQEYIARFKAS